MSQTVSNWKSGDPIPDPSAYRGGSGSGQYLADIGAYNASLQNRSMLLGSATGDRGTGSKPEWTESEIGRGNLPANWPRNKWGGAISMSAMSPSQRALVLRWRRYESDLEEYEARGVPSFLDENPDYEISDWTAPEYSATQEDKIKIVQQNDPGRGGGALDNNTIDGYLWDENVGRDWIEKVELTGAEHQLALDNPMDLSEYFHDGYEYDADTLYMKLPDGGGSLSMMNGFSEEERAHHNRLLSEGQFIDISGGTAKVGEHSMLWVKKPEESSWVGFRDAGLAFARAVAAMVTAGATEKIYTTYKVATGQTLNASDYVNIVIGGLEASGVIAPPVDISGDMVNPIAGGTVGGQIGSELLLGGAVTEGIGLWGLDYVSTVGVINAAINQDPLGVIAAGTGWMQQGFEALGVPPSVANDVDFLKASRETLDMLANGENVQDSMEAGFVRYVKEGGGFGIDLDDGGFFDFDFGVIGDVFDYVSDAVGTVSSTLGDYIDPVLQGAVNIGQDLVDEASDAIGDASSALGDYIDPVLGAVGDAQEAAAEVIGDVSSAIGDVTDPITSAIGDTGSAIDDAVSDAIGDVSSAVGDVTDPITGAIGDAGSALDDVVSDAIGDASSAIGDVTDPITSAIGDAGSALDDVVSDAIGDASSAVDDNVIQPVIEAVENVDLPDIDLPEVDLPSLDVDLPDVELPDFDWSLIFGDEEEEEEEELMTPLGQFLLGTQVGLTEKPLLRYDDPFSEDIFKSTITGKTGGIGGRPLFEYDDPFSNF